MRLLPVLLALSLWAGIAFAATQPDSETQSSDPKTNTPSQDPSPANEDPWEPGYADVPRQGSDWNQGDITVSASTGALRPTRGYLPLDVFFRNDGASTRFVRLGFTPDGSRTEVAVRDVKIGPHQRLVVWLPIPVSMRHGTTRLWGEGLDLPPFTFSALDARGEAVWVLGTEEEFQRRTGLPPMEGRPRLSVRFSPPQDAPRELSAYVGHAAIVLANETNELPVEVWAALEAYAATGGRLVLVRPFRNIDKRLPLLANTVPGVHRYGFGQVRLCHQASDCGGGLLADVRLVEMGSHLWPVEPVSQRQPWEDGDHLLTNGEQPLLPDTRWSAARLPLFILLCVLLAGVGGFAITRRRNPTTRRAVIPLLLLLTALAWAVHQEGFRSKAARYSLLWLDRERNRVLMAGVLGHSTGLSPTRVRVSSLGALLGPDVEAIQQPMAVDWTEGLVELQRAIPPITYQEWGELAVTPTRAQLIVKHDPSGLWVRNALGSPLTEGYFRLDGKVWVIPSLASDAEARALQAPASVEELSLKNFARFPDAVNHRFSAVARQEFAHPLDEGHFLARLGGVGLGFTAQLSMDLREGIHFMRGRVDVP